MTCDYVFRMIVTCFTVFSEKGVVVVSEMKSYLTT